MPYEEFARRMAPHAPTLLFWGLQSMAEEIRRAGATPIYALIPMPMDEPDAPAQEELLATARDAGFILIDLSDVFADEDPSRIIVAAWDRHPNPEGHRAIARRLHRPLVSALALPDTASVTGVAPSH
jgi:hypothetical protein